MEKQSNDHEIVDFIVGRFKKYTGMDKPNKKKKKPGRLPHQKGKLEFDAEEYVEGMW